MQASELELAIVAESKSSTPDMDYVSKLKLELINTKVSLAKNKNKFTQEHTRKRYQTIGNYHKYINILFSKLKQSDQCLTKNPNLAAQVGAQIIGVGSTLASGVIGSLMLSTGSMVDNFISFYRDKELGKKIKAITNNRMGEALGCSFEGLAYNYCQARDVETIIQFNKDKSNIPNNQSWLQGLGVIGQDVQSYLDWATLIDAGTPAGTAGQASDKKAGLSAEFDFKTKKADLNASLSTAKRTVAQSKDKAEATRKALFDLANIIKPANTCTMSGCSVSGPFLFFFSSDPDCGPAIYLYSKGATKTRSPGSDGNLSCSAYIAEKYPDPPDINTDISLRLDELISEAEKSVGIQLSLVNESNPELVISRIDAKPHNQRSAREFLSASLAYLNNLLADPSSIAKKKAQKDLIEKTKSQISNALNIINKTTEPSDPANPKGPTKPADPAKKLEEISKELIPMRDTLAIPKALSELINQDIDHRIGLGQIDENLANLMSLSSNDSLGELIKNYIGLESARSQTRSAKDLTKTNLSSVANIFSENIKNRMEKLSKDAATDSDAKDSLALLCMQTLAVEESPTLGDLDTSKYCSGKVYKSIYDKSGIKMDFNELSSKSYPDRACAVYDFYRKSYLYGLRNTRSLSTPTQQKSTTNQTPTQ